MSTRGTLVALILFGLPSQTFLKLAHASSFSRTHINMLPLKSYSTGTLQNNLEQSEGSERIDLLNELSHRALMIFANDKALEYATEAKTLAQAADDNARQADSLVNLGRAHLNSQRYHLVVQYFEQALKIYQKHNLPGRAARAFYRIADYYWVLRQNSLAQTYFTRALDHFAQAGEKDEVIKTQISLARVYLADGEEKTALQLFLSVLGEIGYDPNNYNSLLVAVRIADIYLSQQQYSEAINRYQKALQLMNEVRDRAWIKDVLRDLGTAHMYSKDYKKARAFFEQSLEMSIDEFDKLNVHQIRVSLSFLNFLEERKERQLHESEPQKEIVENTNISRPSEISPENNSHDLLCLALTSFRSICH